MSSRRYDAGIEFILRHWQDGLTLKAVAGDHGLDPGDLDREFKERCGATVHVFVNERRKEHVVRRITEGGVYAYQIGFELGFRSDWSFYRWVRRAFGISFVRLKGRLADSTVSETGPHHTTKVVPLSRGAQHRRRGDPDRG
jgi:AraC-like DNA-binding protein